MQDLYRLKDMLIKELSAFGKNGSLSKNSLESIDMLAHATKNVLKIIECQDGGQYSSANNSYRMDAAYSRYPNNSYEGRSYDASQRGNGTIKDDVIHLIERMPDEHTKEELMRILIRL